MRPEPPAEWTRAAVDAARTLKARTRWDAKEHDPNHEDPFGVYVGHTHHRPFERYAEHRKGEGFADVQKFHVRLLPELYQHLNPMKPAEAKEMEKALCAALRSAGIGWVTMGSKRRASKEKKQ